VTEPPEGDEETVELSPSPPAEQPVSADNTEILTNEEPDTELADEEAAPATTGGSTVAYGAGPRSLEEAANTDFTLAEPVANEAAAAAGYEILQVLGRGSMGVVYKARQRSANRVVALKMILAGGHASEVELSRFRTEAEAVAHLQHANVVQVYEVGELDGCPYLSMEYVAAGSLQKRIAGVPQPVFAAAQLIEVLARTVDFAHQRGIAHRDLKPANVLLTPPLRTGEGAAASPFPLCDQLYGTPKIADFGLAKRLQEDTGQTRTGAILGTPSYMAPEQALGKSKDVGIAADQYALGAILYELLTGRPPFQGATVWETIDQVRSQEPVPPSRLQPRVPRDLETICLKALEKEPAKRYADTGALADDLHRFIAREPILAQSVSRHERFWRWCRRNPVVSGLLALVCLLVLYGIGYTWLSYYQIRLEQAATEQQRQIALRNQRLAERSAQEANASQNLAEEQRSLTLKTLGTLVTKVQEELNAADDVAEVRRKLLEEARRGLNEVSKSTANAGLLDRNMATAYFQLGGVFEELDQPSDAYLHYRRAYDILAEQASREPGSDRIRASLAVALTKMGDVRRRSQGETAARADYLQALRVRKELVEHPQERTYTPEETRRELANAYAKLGSVSADPVAGWENYEKALEIRKELLAKQPQEEELQQELANTYLGLGDATYHLQKGKEARDYYQAGLSLYEKLTGKQPRNHQYRRMTALAWEKLGTTNLLWGDASLARKQLSDALENYQQAVKLAPRNASYREDLARGNYALASAALQQGDADAAKRYYGEALKIREARLKTNPNDVAVRQATMLTLARCGQTARALEEADKVRQALPGDKDALYAIACCYALCVPARPECADLALATLNEAMNHGFRDTAALETAPELNAVRQLPAYQNLVDQCKKLAGNDAKTKR
jgi:serine/threonine protein kinase